MTIDHWIADAAARDPAKTAILFGAETLSYGALNRAIDHRAANLSAAGIGAGDRVAWYGLNHPELYILLFALARIGGVLVPLNWRLAGPEIAAIVENCGPQLVFHDHTFADAARALPGCQAVAAGDDAPPSRPAPRGRIDAAAPLLIVYTSGSTGRPKGAVLRQSALIANAAMSVEAHEMRADDRVLCILPGFHVGGLNIIATPAFSVGATVDLHAKFDPSLATPALAHAQAAVVVPTVLQAMMADPAWAGLDLSRLRVLSIGSTDVPIDLITAVQDLGVPVIQIYGATETAPFAIYQRIPDAWDHPGSIGRVGSRCAARLIGPDGSDVAPGAIGEIWIKGANILHEYWRDPAETRRALVDGWFKTGDMARQDAAGHYWFADRVKHVIISGGENIYPAEIERVLRQCPGIKEAAIVGQRDAKWGEIPVAVLVADQTSGPAPAPEAVMAHLEARIARYKVPRRLIFVDALPRNAMGKVVAAELRALIAGLAE